MRKALRKTAPTAHEMVYDNYNFFVIGYGPTERPSDAILSLTGSANGVGLCFIHGASLPDPQKILLGSGNQTRFYSRRLGRESWLPGGKARSSRPRSPRPGRLCSPEPAAASSSDAVSSKAKTSAETCEALTRRLSPLSPTP